MRNRRYVSRKGPLIVYGMEGAKLVRSFRNIPGVEIACVDRMNLLKLAPGGHLGRFIIWTRSAFEKLDKVFGTFDKESEQKNGYMLPRSKIANSDLTRIFNSDEIQSVVRPIKKEIKRKPLKKNPLKNLGALLKLNPYAKPFRPWKLQILFRSLIQKITKPPACKKNAPEPSFSTRSGGDTSEKGSVNDVSNPKIHVANNDIQENNNGDGENSGTNFPRGRSGMPMALLFIPIGINQLQLILCIQSYFLHVWTLR